MDHIKYEYILVSIQPERETGLVILERIAKMAKQGWRISQPIIMTGVTAGYFMERPVSK